jgi:hypothetical protein
VVAVCAEGRRRSGVLTGQHRHLARLDGLHPQAHAVLVGVALYRPQTRPPIGSPRPSGSTPSLRRRPPGELSALDGPAFSVTALVYRLAVPPSSLQRMLATCN